jgi:hypothetical protein
VAWKAAETFDGKPVERLDFLTASGGQFSMYLDAKSFLPAGLKFTGNTAAGPGEITEVILGFAKSGKLMLPAKVHRDEGGMSMDIEFTGTNLSPTYNEVDFQKPDSF